MWPIEARCASIANNYFTVAINRIGTVSTLTLLETKLSHYIHICLVIGWTSSGFYLLQEGRDVRPRCGNKALLFLFRESETWGLKMLLSERLERRHSASDPCNIAYLTFEKIKGFLFTCFFAIGSLWKWIYFRGWQTR